MQRLLDLFHPTPNDCDGLVPVVSTKLGHELAQRKLSPERRHEALMRCMEWLVTHHEGLESHQGITGRPYLPEERTFGLEVGAAAETGCPFKLADGSCALGGLGRNFTRQKELGHEEYGFLPMLLAREWDLRTVRELVARGQVADAKAALLTRNEGFPQAKQVQTLGQPLREEAIINAVPPTL